MHENLASLQEALGNRYRLLRELGSGGMATVYLAEDTERGGRVAVKVLRRELTAILGTTRFHREIEILSGLQHPNIVPVLDSRQAGTRLYYVMPFVPGDSVRARLERQGPFPVEDVIRIAKDIGEAIDYAHEHGVLHRDIKPENVLFDGPRALVCDFGVARVGDHDGGRPGQVAAAESRCSMRADRRRHPCAGRTAPQGISPPAHAQRVRVADDVGDGRGEILRRRRAAGSDATRSGKRPS